MLPSRDRMLWSSLASPLVREKLSDSLARRSEMACAQQQTGFEFQHRVQEGKLA